MRVRTREAHWRRGLAQPPSLGRAKDEEELRAPVSIFFETLRVIPVETFFHSLQEHINNTCSDAWGRLAEFLDVSGSTA